ncbi:cytochrome c biogenesis protein ResB [Symbiobacterium thermophilum]|uniref:cytochrome c biogenesis protein ResB n=1 Tax=Symbiobacterium thermophilum TaxID=2734 RepID=UPI002356A390|nr:cytochrome c biogenesis protein ResB [Symbiobacterium thermophilum]
MGDRSRARVEGPNPWVVLLDRTWDFFASTKVASWIIIALAIASIAGTVIEQEGMYQDWRPPELYYPDRYGEFWGSLFLRLGLTHAYSSWWYAALVMMLVISLVICSLHRLVPLHRQLTRPQVWKLPQYLRKQQVVLEVPGDLQQAAERLKRAGYRIWRDRECLYAEKGRLSRYGPYILHIGLLVVCFAAFAKALPGWDEVQDVWIPDGQTVKVPGENFAITNHKFTMELYENGMPSRYATDASIIVDGEEVLRRTIEVNKPLKYGGWEIYQASWREEPGVAHLRLVEADTGSAVATVAFDLRDPSPEYSLEGTGLKLVVLTYLHDFVLDPETNQPTNASYEVRNPVLFAEVATADGSEMVGRIALAMAGGSEVVYTGPYYLELDRVESRWYTALKLHHDRTVPYMYFGLAVVFVGMVITFFIYHWQVWVREENGGILIGARAYKNRFALAREIKRIFGAPQGEGLN